MKMSILLVSMILALTTTYSLTKITSYNINVEFKPYSVTMHVNASLTFKNDEQSDTILLLFNSDSKILNMKYPINETTFALTYFKGGKDTLYVILNEMMKSIQNFVINFEYEYPLEKDSVILLDRGYRWYPMIAEDIYPFTMTVQIPENYTAISAGNIINERTIEGFKQISYDSRQPVFKIPLIIAPENYYIVKEKDCGEIKSYFYEINDSNSGKFDSVNIDICNLINYFSATIGKYPHDRFTLVETSVFPGSNLGSSIVTSGLDNFESFLLGNNDWLNMAVASQWICTGVFPRLFCKGFWFLSISFPHYLRLMYDRETRGEEFFNKEIDNLKETYKKIEGSEGDIPILDVDYPNTREKGFLLYAKGVLVLNKLKMELGEAKWIEILRYFYSEYNGKVIILDDFINSINKFDSTGYCSTNLLKMLKEKGLPE